MARPKKKLYARIGREAKYREFDCVHTLGCELGERLMNKIDYDYLMYRMWKNGRVIEYGRWFRPKPGSQCIRVYWKCRCGFKTGLSTGDWGAFVSGVREAYGLPHHRGDFKIIA